MKSTLLLMIFYTVSFRLNAQSVETIHIHFDKNIYLPGETIWFKAYLQNGKGNLINSTNFYIALYDEDGQLQQQKKYPIFDAAVNGDFELPDTLESSKIQLIAFTKAMWLKDSTKIYKKELAVYNNNIGGSGNAFASNQNISIQFFPEGGNNVEAIPNYIAFRAKYENGYPAQVKGVIIEQDSKKIIDSFFTNEMGMGKFQMIPQANTTYLAIWKDDAGSENMTPLPPVSKVGATLHVEQFGNYLHYIITKNSLASNSNQLKLVAKMWNEELYTATFDLKNSTSVINKIPLDSFHNGLLHLTLFEVDNVPLQHRTVLIHKNDKTPRIFNSQQSDSTKEKNVIEIALPDTTMHNLSLSIADINFYEEAQTSTIHHTFLFDESTVGIADKIKAALQHQHQNDLDLLMLTKEWHQFDTIAPFQNTTDSYLSLELNYHHKNYALPKNKPLSLIINDSVTGKQFYSPFPATQTSFTQSGLIFYDSAKVYYRNNNDPSLEKYFKIQQLDTIKMPLVIDRIKRTNDLAIPPNNIISINNKDSFLKSFLDYRPKKFNDIQTIKEVVVKSRYVNLETKRILELDEKYTSGMFSGIARGYQVNVLDDPKVWNYIDIYSYLSLNIPGMRASGRVGSRSIGARGTPLLFIDECERPMEMLETVSITQVAYIKYITGIVIGASFISRTGVLYIYLKKGNEIIPSNIPIMPFFRVKGYDLPKEFQVNKSLIKEDKSLVDVRSTLYWNPSLQIENNKVKIEYYNNDLSKKLLLVLEGVNEHGELIRIEKIIQN